MCLTLGIDTAGATAYAAIVEADTIHAAAAAASFGNAETLPTLIESCCASAGVRLEELKAVAVAIGPGSFTGIRSGIAAAEGLALGLGARVIGVSVLLSRALENGLLNAAYAEGAGVLSVLRASKSEAFYAAFAGEPANCAVVLDEGSAVPIDEIGQLKGSLEIRLNRPLLLAGAERIYQTAAENSSPEGANPAVLTALGARLTLQTPAGNTGSLHLQAAVRAGLGVRPIYMKGVAAKTIEERRAKAQALHIV